MKTLREQIAGSCVHFSGTINPACEVGIRYAEFKDPASGKRAAFDQMPCFSGDGRLPCERRQFPTAEEVEAEVAASDRAISNVGKARRAIVASKLAHGAIDCPVCARPKSLQFSVSSYNGHIHAACPGCVSWME